MDGAVLALLWQMRAADSATDLAPWLGWLGVEAEAPQAEASSSAAPAALLVAGSDQNTRPSRKRLRGRSADRWARGGTRIAHGEVRIASS